VRRLNHSTAARQVALNRIRVQHWRLSAVSDFVHFRRRCAMAGQAGATRGTFALIREHVVFLRKFFLLVVRTVFS
jgi:hypothetical protein